MARKGDVFVRLACRGPMSSAGLKESSKAIGRLLEGNQQSTTGHLSSLSLRTLEPWNY